MYQRDSASRLAFGTINVIFAMPRNELASCSGVMSVVLSPEPRDQAQESKGAKLESSPTLGFSEKDKVGTYQPYDDALVVNLQIGGYDMKRVLVNQGSGAKIMYPNLYKGLNLKPEDLERYDSPLVGFDGRTIIPRGMIKLPVQADDEEVQVNFIVVEAYSPYTAILVRP